MLAGFGLFYCIVKHAVESLSNLEQYKRPESLTDHQKMKRFKVAAETVAAFESGIDEITYATKKYLY